MRSFTTVAVPILAAVVLFGARCEAASKLIVPGSGIGPIHLGMPPEDVHKLHGYAKWRREPVKAGMFVESTGRTDVVYEDGRAVEVATRQTIMHAADGLSIKSSLDKWSSVYHFTVNRWSVQLDNVPANADNDGYIWSVYDDAAAGIAVTLEEVDYAVAEDTPAEIIVHAPGRRAIRYVVGGRLGARDNGQPQLFVPTDTRAENEMKANETARLTPGERVTVGSYTHQFIGAPSEESMVHVRPIWLKGAFSSWDSLIRKYHLFVENLDNGIPEAEFVSYGKSNVIAVRMLSKVHVGEIVYVFRETVVPEK